MILQNNSYFDRNLHRSTNKLCVQNHGWIRNLESAKCFPLLQLKYAFNIRLFAGLFCIDCVFFYVRNREMAENKTEK